MKPLIWLASYPKSGNTWVRAFLNCYLNKHDKEIDINNINHGAFAVSRDAFDDYLGLSSADLTHEQINCYRPEVYELLANNIEKKRVFKLHDAYTYNADGKALFPASVTHCAIYLVRHPLDVAASWAFHSGIDVQDSLRTLENNEFALSSEKHSISSLLPQKVLSWASHVKSWEQVTQFPVYIIRYEDLKKKPIESFSTIIKAIGWEIDSRQLLAALECCRFERLQQKERESGFWEKSHRSEQFFRRGKCGDWKNYYTSRQAQDFFNRNKDIMLRYGYTEAS